MPKLNPKIEKLYYSIGEIAEMFEVSKSLIRFWDAEFTVLKPIKNSRGERRFTKQNIEQFRLIYHLVKEKGYTLEGAKRELKTRQKFWKRRNESIEQLRSLKVFLEALKDKI